MNNWAAWSFASLFSIYLLAFGAQAAVIGFDPLTGVTGDPYGGHSEQGFTVSASSSDWKEGHFRGNPVPSVYASGITTMSVRSSERTQPNFTFSSVDLASGNNRPFSYTVRGYLDNWEVLSDSGVLRGSSYWTLASDEPNQELDRLVFSFRAAVGTPSFSVDNIAVELMPSNYEPPQPLKGRLETAVGSGVFLAYYDPNLDITWSQNANINGFASYNQQVAWAAGLTIGGVSGWRLPTADVDGDGLIVGCGTGGALGPECADNEVDFLAWEHGINCAEPGPFSNILCGWNEFYWTDPPIEGGAPEDPIEGWISSFDPDSLGLAGTTDINDAMLAWAVRDGDVPALVPVPAAAWLFGSALGLVGWLRRRTT